MKTQTTLLMLIVAPAGVSLARPDQGSSRIWQVKPQGERRTVLKHPVELIKTIASLKNSPHRSLQWRGFLLIPLALVLACFALSQRAQGVVPAPDGGYANFNTAEGQSALFSLTSGAANTAVGWFSLKSIATGGFNTGVGAGTLVLNAGDDNTATGAAALLLNTTGQRNTANGTAALVNNSDGDDNTAVGVFALNSNTASGNTAVGSNALFSNTDGGTLGTLPVPPPNNHPTGPNVAVGQHALESNTLGSGSVAVGYQALASFVEGPIVPDPPNPDIDVRALAFNTAVGFQALANATGFSNSAFGYHALFNVHGDVLNNEGILNVAIGTRALVNNQTGSLNIALGDDAGLNVTTANGVICIGAEGANEAFTTWIDNIYAVTTVNATTLPVIVSQDGQLGTQPSSARFKKDIQPIDKDSETILALKPVKFHYKSDKANTPQFGLIAEEVAKVNPALVLPDEERRPYTVRYDAVNAMLLNEFLKEHRKVEQQDHKIWEQGATILELKKEMAGLATTVKEQAAQIQKVSAQIKVGKLATGQIRRGAPARQLATNDH